MVAWIFCRQCDSVIATNASTLFICSCGASVDLRKLPAEKWAVPTDQYTEVN